MFELNGSSRSKPAHSGSSHSGLSHSGSSRNGPALSTPPSLRLLSTAKPSPLPLHWGAATPSLRGPVLAGLPHQSKRNAIGMYGGSYSVYRALAIASGQLSAQHHPNLHNTQPTQAIAPNPRWFESGKIVTLDPFGANIGTDFAEVLAQGHDLRPTIAITQANLQLVELEEAIAQGRLPVDGQIVRPGQSGAARPTHDLRVTKIAIDPVWYLPGIAARLGVSETHLRQALHLQTGGMYADLLDRPDLKVFLPPIGGTTVYIVGDPSQLAPSPTPSPTPSAITLRIHDECNGSDVFGSDICTCRPYLIHGIEECVLTAQRGGVGLIVYGRKEGRALGEVTKFLVYNARKRQQGGDRASTYFERTECVAGVQDMRFQVLMPDVLHWLGVTHIDRLVSMSNLKYDAIIEAGISVGERVALPSDRIPSDAQVEIEAKKAAGYYVPPEIL